MHNKNHPTSLTPTPVSLVLPPSDSVPAIFLWSG